tara:strand:- start:578 stop:1138 length:561 start_codon:yes stop_codon:yes gene_type:complete
MILCKEENAEVVNKAIIPGIQGGPHIHTISAIAVALQEATTPEFKTYAQQVVKNAKALAERLLSHGFRLVTGGTDNHLILMEVFESKGIPGREASKSLDKAGIVCNCNMVPFDKRTPFNPSGIRIGTPSMSSRGMKETEMEKLGDWINEAISNAEDETVLARIAGEVKSMCIQFPAPGIDPANWNE